MDYLHWDQKTITDFAVETIGEMYSRGYVFTRIGKGVMQQTRSVRIDLNKFILSSENRRISKKTGHIVLSSDKLPLKTYNYSIGKLAKDFYDVKFAKGIMSAQKIKEMLIDLDKSNFNLLLEYSATPIGDITTKDAGDAGTKLDLKHDIDDAIGFAICFSTPSLLHYSYPFYDIKKSPKNMGLGMMISAILYAKEAKMRYVYLGSLQRPKDAYKLQFEGLEWFDGNTWQVDMADAKKVLQKIKTS
jgi:arginyl-tRNA--protein-N-Asp/Glu arginylyltransferase